MTNPPRHIGCKVTGCPNPHRSLGYCSVHYGRMHRLGTTELPPRGIGRANDTRKPRRRGVEDAVKVRENIVGTITLEEWKRQRASERAGIHVVRHQPDIGTNGLGGRGRGGDAA